MVLGAPKKKAPRPPAPPARAKAASDAKAKAKAEAESGAALSAAQLEQLTKKYDTNKDASLSFAEFKKICTELAMVQKGAMPTDNDLEDIFDEFDKDNSDQLSMKEFHWAYASLKVKMQDSAATKIQAQVRGNQARQGKPPAPPLPPKQAGAKARAKHTGTAALSEEQLEQLRQKHDTNQDKMINQEEFDAMAQEIATLMGHKLPPGSSMKEIFDQFDKDKSGQMSMDEFNWAYATLQQEVEENAALKIQAAFRGNQARSNVDTMKMTKAGHPPPPKGVAAVKSKAKTAAAESGTAGLTQAQMVALREKFDLDGDQTLGLAEFKGLARQVAQLQGHAAPSYAILEDIFDEFDKDFTGKMGSEEFNWAYATLQLKVKEEAAKEASRLMKVSLNRSGQKLGLTVDSKTLEIKDIISKSVVAEWNLANPTKPLQVGHRIKKVNGKPGIQGYNEELLNKSVEVLNLEVVAGEKFQKVPRFYFVRLDRSAGGKLGIQVEQPSLEIQNLAPGGLACKWNEEHPKERIRPGDSIVKVNDKDGMAGFKEEMMNPNISVLNIQLAPLSRYHEDDEEIQSESSVLTDEEEALERYKVVIHAMQEFSAAEQKRRANAEKRRLKAIRDGKEVLTKLEASSADFYRQMASCTLPEDLSVQAEEDRRKRFAIEEARRHQERIYEYTSFANAPSVASEAERVFGRSTFACPCCGRLFHVFHEDGRYHAVVAHGVELLGQSPELLPRPGPPAAVAGVAATAPRSALHTPALPSTAPATPAPKTGPTEGNAFF